MTGTITRTRAERMAAGNNGKNHTAAALAAAVWMAQNGLCMEEIQKYIKRRYLLQECLDDSTVKAFEIFFASKNHEEALFTAKPCGGEVADMVAKLAEAYYSKT